MDFHSSRVRALSKKPLRSNGPVIYWMDRDMRLEDNWAYVFAHQLAEQYHVPLLVVYNLDPAFLGGTIRQLTFKVQALREIETCAQEQKIPFFVLSGNETEKDIADFIEQYQASVVITDFSPLRIQRAWKTYVGEHIQCPLLEVDAHNSIPAWIVSPKYEIAARTIRPKIHRLLGEYLTDFPPLTSASIQFTGVIPRIDWDLLLMNAKTRRDVEIAHEFVGGASIAQKRLNDFIQNHLARYDEERNDPMSWAASELSPYLHYGVIAPQRVAYEVSRATMPQAAKDVFLEELIVRRELSDNFCFHHLTTYDSLESAPKWAIASLDAHRNDTREFLYSREDFEKAQTHDPLWNAAQRELLIRGKMHGYMRMYWAKKILEWTTSPEEALQIALYLNDTYQLDGRDPNGYVGVLWSIAWVHDRPWFDRSVYGVIRYMARSGCEKKFDVAAYIRTWSIR